MLVVPHFVRPDAPRQIAQHRLGTYAAQRLVEGRRAHLHDATSGHLEAARGLVFLRAAKVGILIEELGVGAIPLKFGPDSSHVGLQRATVLQLLRLPMLAQPYAHLGVIDGEVAEPESRRCSRAGGVSVVRTAHGR